jgi:hypothetical protein
MAIPVQFVAVRSDQRDECRAEILLNSTVAKREGKRATATNCPSDLSDFQSLCDLTCPLQEKQPAECQAAVVAYDECAQNLEYSCAPGGEVPLPGDTTPCTTEFDALNSACPTTTVSRMAIIQPF